MGEGRGGFEMHADVVGGGDARGSNRDHVTRYLGSDDNKVTAGSLDPLKVFCIFVLCIYESPFITYIYLPTVLPIM